MILSVWPMNVDRSEADVTFQILTVVSSEPLASNTSLFSAAKHVTLSVWPTNVLLRVPLANSQILIVMSREALAIRLVIYKKIIEIKKNTMLNLMIMVRSLILIFNFRLEICYFLLIFF